MTVLVKICGIKNTQQLNAVINAGADFIGFVYYPKSPRHLELSAIKTLIETMPNHVYPVVVTVDPDDGLVEKINMLSPAYIQLHGNESPARVNEIKSQLTHTMIIKAIPVKTADDINHATEYTSCADLLLFDTKADNMHGGSGKSFDWSLLAGKKIALPWMLSGGLTPVNVADAIAQTDAGMVDVSSGVESAPGVKDTVLIKQFIEAAKRI